MIANQIYQNKEKLKMNGLVLHCGAEEVSREELKNIETPKSTLSWKPVPHYEVAEMVYGHAREAKLEIIEEKYGVTEDGSKMFGFLRFQKGDNPEYQRCIITQAAFQNQVMKM